MMNRLLATTAVALLLGLAPAFAAEESSAPPAQSTVSPEAANEATVPDEGSADTSGGAKEQSSAHPESGAVKDEQSSEAMPPDANADPSSGAKEQSSAPPGSSAEDSSQPNPTIGADGSNMKPEGSTE